MMCNALIFVDDVTVGSVKSGAVTWVQSDMLMPAVRIRSVQD
jgi:hypothetical protein